MEKEVNSKTFLIAIIAIVAVILLVNNSNGLTGSAVTTSSSNCVTKQGCPGTYNFYRQCLDTPNDGCPVPSSGGGGGVGGKLSCTDSDGGKDYYVKGIAQGYPDIVQGSIYDCCKNSMKGGACVNYSPYLSEAICDGTTPSNIMYQCPNGCKDGACIVPSSGDGGGVGVISYRGVLEMLNKNCIIWSVANPDPTRQVTGDDICKERNAGICIFTIFSENLNNAIGTSFGRGGGVTGPSLGFVDRCSVTGPSDQTVAYCCSTP